MAQLALSHYQASRLLQTVAKEETSDQDSSVLLTVHPDILEVISRRNLSIIELSPYITEGIEDALKVSPQLKAVLAQSPHHVLAQATSEILTNLLVACHKPTVKVNPARRNASDRLHVYKDCHLHDLES